MHESSEFVSRKPVPVHILTDSRGMFEILSEGDYTNWKRDIFDIFVA